MRPILFKGYTMRAILAGFKTQTRRIYKKPGEFIAGETRWIRENWRVASWDRKKKEVGIKYKADGGLMLWPAPPEFIKRLDAELKEQERMPKSPSPYRKRPSIFLPMWACRAALDLTSVRVEPLHQMSNQDAILEGTGFEWEKNAGWPDYRHIKDGTCLCTQPDARASFSTLWDAIHGNTCPWNSNPDVYAIEFKRGPYTP